jgi:hypothetical protein
VSLGTVGQGPPSSVWDEERPASGDYALAQGGRYAVLASVSRNYSLAEVASYLTGHGWAVTYLWEEGSPTRDTYAIDAWLSSLGPDPTGNHRWVYGEGNRVGESATLGRVPPWPFTFYSLSHVFRAVPAPPGAGGGAPALPSSEPAPSPSAAPSGWLLAGAAVLGAVGWALIRRI